VRPFHPLYGKVFRIVTSDHTWGEERMQFEDDGTLRSLPAGWTGVAPVDPFVAMAAGRAPFRTAGVLRMVVLVRQLKLEGDQG